MMECGLQLLQSKSYLGLLIKMSKQKWSMVNPGLLATNKNEIEYTTGEAGLKKLIENKINERLRHITFVTKYSSSLVNIKCRNHPGQRAPSN